MGFFRFRRSFKILPGVRWNLNKRGSSFTFGRRGFKYTVGNKGSRTTVGIPGTGVSYTQVHSTVARSNQAPPPLPQTQMAVSGQQRGMNKAGCLYAAGLTVIGVWLLTFLNSVQNPTVQQQIATLASPSPALPKPPLIARAVPISTPLAASPVPGRTYVPETSVPIQRAIRVRPPAEEARIQRFVPPRVTMRQGVEFLAINPKDTTPSVYVGAGKEVAVIRVAGPDLILGDTRWQAKVRTEKTDFLDRVIAEVEK